MMTMQDDDGTVAKRNIHAHKHLTLIIFILIATGAAPLLVCRDYTWIVIWSYKFMYNLID